jgi:bifunctional DNase/RNase
VLPIWIGPAEAQAIARELAGQRFQRPLTHDLIATIVEGLKARVTRVVIADLKDNTFFAQLLVDREGEVVVIDARPSDSLAVALRCGADIFVNEKLLSEAAEEEPTEEEKAQELRKFLENLDPEDFGKYNP